jgi:hypothetical protein
MLAKIKRGALIRRELSKLKKENPLWQCFWNCSTVLVILVLETAANTSLADVRFLVNLSFSHL